ncbi:glycosyl transferase [Capsulimonas corticalis]|uniref:Glycosyl transferase n=1 Tax=Capsulimonas corticalis TaxID=2219043 RepID=A0A402CXD6_9BACT|nr:glycosyltransferase family 2 protein [Capsulimonas corticalis]BDI32316.1 glycosyl transferase [Capsulimonas corticalis]
MTDIAVIIVNWNAQKDLRVCLQSLYADPKPKSNYEVWVVDNASTDGSAEMVRSEFPDVKLIANTENVGFSKANNQAIAASQSRYVFLLNSDAFAHEGAIDTLVSYADAHPQAGIIGPRVLNADGTLQFSCRRFPSLMAGFFRNTFLGKIAPQNKYAAEYLMWDISHDRDQSVDWISGCAMMIRRTLIDRIGALDERFYMYCEDVDICRRTWEDGFEVVYAPQAVVTHIIGRSSDNNAEKMIVEFHRSWYEYDLKHHPDGGPVRRSVVYSGLWLRGAVRIARRRSNEKRYQKNHRESGS